MSISLHIPRASAPQWTRLYRVGAAGAAAVLIGTVGFAPFAATTIVGSGTAGGGDGAVRQALAVSGSVERPLDLSFSLFEDTSGDKPAALYTLAQFMSSGVVNWGGYRFTYYSQQVLPGGGLAIPGRHVSEAGYVTDADGYIVLAGSAPKGSVFPTPFGADGKIYDRGTVGNHLDVYVR